MSILAISTGYNSPPRNPSDATGAFLPESKRFIKIHGGSRTIIKARGTPRSRRLLSEAAIRKEALDVLAVFGHGIASQCIATGHGIAHVPALADAIEANACEFRFTVIFYCCLTSKGKRGFADHLSDLLTGRGFDPLIWAHTTAGHATVNPFVELAGGPSGGTPVVAKGEPLWKRWRERLQDQEFRLSFWRAAAGAPSRAEAIEVVRSAV